MSIARKSPVGRTERAGSRAIKLALRAFALAPLAAGCAAEVSSPTSATTQALEPVHFGAGSVLVGGAAATGSRPLIILRMRFRDRAFAAHHTAEFHKALFFAAPPMRSVNNYYREKRRLSRPSARSRSACQRARAQRRWGSAQRLQC